MLTVEAETLSGLLELELLVVSGLPTNTVSLSYSFAFSKTMLVEIKRYQSQVSKESQQQSFSSRRAWKL